MAKTEWIRLRVSADEKRLAQAQAERLKVGVSELLRGMIADEEQSNAEAAAALSVEEVAVAAKLRISPAQYLRAKTGGDR